MRPKPWLAYLLAGTLATGGYFLLPSLALHSLSYDALNLSAVAAILLGVRLHRPRRRAAWYLFAAGVLSFAVGDMTWSYYELVLRVEAPFPSAADAFYLAGYPIIAVGLLLLVRGRIPGRDRASLIDAAIVTTGLTVLLWVYLVVPFAYDPSLSWLERVVSIAYPLGDVLLIAVAARLLISPGARTGAYRLLSLSLLFLLVADAVYAVLAQHGTYFTGHPVDGAWILSNVLWGAAALHPAMRPLSEPAPDRETRLTRVRLVLLAGASLIPVAVLAVQGARGSDIHVPVIAGGCAVLFLLVVLRMAGLVREVAARVVELRAQGVALEGTLDELQHAQAERAALLDRSLRATEQERIRIAGELHDGPIQRLSELGLDIDLAHLRLERGQVAGATGVLDEARQELAQNIESLRRMMAGLRPPALDERGLAAALRDQVEGFARRLGIECSMESAIEERLDPELETALYRVAQEALTNIGKHAGASHVWVLLSRDQRSVVLDIRDDGVGFDTSAVHGLLRTGHFGLVAMRERVEMAGGTWELRLRPGQGTAIRVAFPQMQAALR
ncbi:MAG: sensor histidine kinase [Actinomycetota bacterium]